MSLHDFHVGDKGTVSAGALRQLVFQTSADVREQAATAGSSRAGCHIQERRSLEDPDDDDTDVRIVSQRQGLQLDDSDTEKPSGTLAGTSTQDEIRQKVCSRLPVWTCTMISFAP